MFYIGNISGHILSLVNLIKKMANSILLTVKVRTNAITKFSGEQWEVAVLDASTQAS